MRKLSCIMILVVLLVSCHDNMDLSQLQEKDQLVVYCFPTSTDTTEIHVSTSIPVNGARIYLDSVNASFEINGKRKTAYFQKKIENNNLYELVYYVVGKLNIGDKVSVKVMEDRFSETTATTFIPNIPDIQSVFMDSVYNSGNFYNQIRLKLKSSQNKDYFAIRVIGREESYNGDVDSTYIYLRTQEIETSNEPILNNYSMGETSFNTDNDFYHNLYIFDNSTFGHDSTYTLHLNVKSKAYINSYKVQLYRITPELYHFIKSVNDIGNNEMGDYGMSFVQPSYTNIINGLGVVGGYALKETGWLSRK